MDIYLTYSYIATNRGHNIIDVLDDNDVIVTTLYLEDMEIYCKASNEELDGICNLFNKYNIHVNKIYALK